MGEAGLASAGGAAQQQQGLGVQALQAGVDEALAAEEEVAVLRGEGAQAEVGIGEPGEGSCGGKRGEGAGEQEEELAAVMPVQVSKGGSLLGARGQQGEEPVAQEGVELGGGEQAIVVEIRGRGGAESLEEREGEGRVGARRRGSPERAWPGACRRPARRERWRAEAGRSAGRRSGGSARGRGARGALAGRRSREEAWGKAPAKQQSRTSSRWRQGS